MKTLRLLFVLLPLFSCSNPQNLHLLAPDTLIDEISKSSSNICIVYYHSGECSFCYGVLAQITHDLNTLNVISLSSNNDSDLIEDYLVQTGFEGISIVDTAAIRLTNNEVIASGSCLFLVDKTGLILFRSFEYNNRITVRIEKTIKNYRQRRHK